MKKFDPNTMISVREAKEYAMKRRFEVKPESRVRVCLYSCDSENAFPYAFTEKDGSVLDSFYAWDESAINRIGERGAYYSVFERNSFFNLFSDYPKK